MISVIVPTYNEAKNIPELVSSVDRALSGIEGQDVEILIMDDDSPDGTARLAEDLEYPGLRAINRKGKPRGLAYAVIDGFAAAKGQFLAVIDADLSHPPSVLPELYAAIEEGHELAVASRYVPGGGTANWPWIRRFVSRGVSCFGRLVTPVRDSASGCFMLKREVLRDVTLDPLGFKIGLEVIVKGRHEDMIKEVPYVFTDRRAGESKLGPGVMFSYLKQVARLFFYQRRRQKPPDAEADGPSR